MKLSSKSRYGLKACVILAKEELSSVSKLASMVATTEKYMEQILILLKKDGIVGTRRGTAGGYYLLLSPKDISVARVLRAFSDGPEMLECQNVDCVNSGTCPTKTVWHKLYSSINDCLEGISLADMLEEHADKTDTE